MNKLNIDPPKGTSDLFPEDFRKYRYVFDTWREVCIRFGYEEYLTPLIEQADLYLAKSGEDLGGKELWTLKDLADREYAIRPEMTPSVTRMVAGRYEQLPKPIRYFSIANFMRNEKPQRGRAREFWQLNCDIFGSDTISADIEILQIALEIMLAFGPPKNSFTIYINNRKLIDFLLLDYAGVNTDDLIEVTRVLDKWEKFEEKELITRLEKLNLAKEQIEKLKKFMSAKDAETLKAQIPEIAQNEGFAETVEIMQTLENLGYADWTKFQPNIIRGFDYYDGMIFEVFDNNPENNRSMFGGGRYNGLADLFGKSSFPATGCAPGQLTTILFLEAWELMPDFEDQKDYFIPILDKDLMDDYYALATKLRGEGKIVRMGLEEQKFGKAIDYANRSKVDFFVILGEDERKEGVYKLKDMESGEELTINN